jgi:hypothetical protein
MNPRKKIYNDPVLGENGLTVGSRFAPYTGAFGTFAIRGGIRASTIMPLINLELRHPLDFAGRLDPGCPIS